MDTGDVADQDGGTSAVGPHGNAFNVTHRFDIAEPAHHILCAGKFHDPAADLVVGAPDRVNDLTEGQVVRQQCRRIDVHLVLFDEPAHGGNLCDPFHTGQPVTQVPVLK